MRRFGSVALSVLLVALAVQTAPAASAQSAPDTAGLAATLATRLGDSSPGSYMDSSGQLVVTVTNEADAAAVRAAGAQARVVARSASQLRAATAELDRTAAFPGTSWGVDPITDQVVVTADSTVTGAALERLKSVVGGLGAAARLERTAGQYRTTIAGGEAIIGGGVRCSLGFNVKKAGTAYLLTAGHCGNVASTWATSGGQVIASRVGTSFPNNDYSLFQYTSSIDRPGTVDLYNGTQRDVSAAGNPVVGQTVGRSGSTSGFHRGTVTQLNTTVHYSDGTTVNGMIATTVCVEAGDSGGPLFANNTALGLTSGGSGDCTSGGQSFYQPVTEALSVYGVSIY